MFITVVILLATFAVTAFASAFESRPQHRAVLDDTMHGKTHGQLALPQAHVIGSNIVPSLHQRMLRRKARLSHSISVLSASKASSLAILGSKLVEQGRYSDAALQLKASLALVPDHNRVLHCLGIAQEKLGLSMEALESYRSALAVDPSFAHGYVSLSCLLEDLQCCDEAAVALCTALEIEPKRADAWSRLAMMYQSSLDLLDAQEAFATAVAMSPADPSLRNPFAGLLRSMGRFDEAYAEQLHATQLTSRSTDIFEPMRSEKACLAFAPATIAGSKIASVGMLVEQSRVAACLKRSTLLSNLPEWIERLSLVHMTRVATKAQCERAIEIAELHAASTGGWKDRSHHSDYKTNNIVVADNEELEIWVQALLRYSIWPAIKLQFDIDPHELWLEDCFLVKYEVSAQAGLASHEDDSELSFNLLLSDPTSFEGGGTAFKDALPEEATLRPAQGEMITHCGFVQHEGKRIVGGGPRYVLAGFVRVQPIAKKWQSLKGRYDDSYV